MNGVYIRVSFDFNGNSWGRVGLKPEVLLLGSLCRLLLFLTPSMTQPRSRDVCRGFGSGTWWQSPYSLFMAGVRGIYKLVVLQGSDYRAYCRTVLAPSFDSCYSRISCHRLYKSPVFCFEVGIASTCLLVTLHRTLLARRCEEAY